MTTIERHTLIASKSGVLYSVIDEWSVRPIGKGPIRDIPKIFTIVCAADDPQRAEVVRAYREGR